MSYDNATIEELNILTRFNLHTTQEGIKIHSSADPQLIEATRRLFDKGLISQVDGGYLTALGRTAAEHAQALEQIIR